MIEFIGGLLVALGFFFFFMGMISLLFSGCGRYSHETWKWCWGIGIVCFGVGILVLDKTVLIWMGLI